MVDQFLPGRNIVGSDSSARLAETYFNVRNPLRDYRSHTYRWVITAHNSLDSAKQPLSVEDLQITIGETTSTGGIVVVNELADARVSVNELTWTALTVTPNDVTRGLCAGSLSLTEPYGVGLLSMMKQWEQQLGTQFVGQTLFAARVYFMGHKDDGSSERLTGYPGGDRALFFTNAGFDVSFTIGDGVMYMMPDIIPVNGGTLADGEFSPIASLASDKINREEIERRQNETNANRRTSDVATTFAQHVQQGSPFPASWKDSMTETRTETVFVERGMSPTMTVLGTDKAVRATYTNIKSGIVKPGANTTVTFRDPTSGKPVSVSVAVKPPSVGVPSEVKYSQDVGKAFADHYHQSSSAVSMVDSDGDGLTDADEERIRANEVRCQTLKSINTVSEAFIEFERALNEAALKWFDIQTSRGTDDGMISPLRYTYSIVPEDDLGSYVLDITTPKTQQSLQCVAPDAATETRDVAPVNISFDRRWPIKYMILHILSHSKRVADEVDLNVLINGQPKRKATSKTVRIRTMRIDQGKNQPIKIVFKVALADSAVPKDRADLSTRASGDAELEFDFMYGNRYTDLLDFDLSLDWGSMYATRAIGNIDENKLYPGDATRNVTAVVASTTATRTDQTRVQAAAGSPAAAATSHPSRSQVFLNAIGDAMQLAHSQIDIKTIGDPFLCYDTMGDVEQFISNTQPVGYYFKETQRDPMRVKLNIRYPVYHDPQPGEPGTTPSAYTIEKFWFDKPYHLISITNSFSAQDGFTQMLQLLFPSTEETDD